MRAAMPMKPAGRMKSTRPMISEARCGFQEKEEKYIDDVRINDEIKRPKQPPKGLLATLDEIKGLYDVAGENHIIKTQKTCAEKAPIGARVLPCANN